MHRPALMVCCCIDSSCHGSSVRGDDGVDCFRGLSPDLHRFVQCMASHLREDGCVLDPVNWNFCAPRPSV
jgi:hypothetical protein